MQNKPFNIFKSVFLSCKHFRRCFSSSQKAIKEIPPFVDFLTLKAIGGSGGNGLKKYGGYGGDGGYVVVVSSKNVQTLRQVWKKYPNQICKADSGMRSDKFCLLGEKGNNLILQVPQGVLIHKANGEIVDLNDDEEICVVARGGVGGNPDTNFFGRKGEDNMIGLELKLLADVGLVGFPNAGKSTFLNAISKAKPKIGAYPFTTLSPQLGSLQYADGRRISIADLPGLIEGSHLNYGMGFKFLRHAERNKILLFILDINPFQLSLEYPERSPFETLLLLNKELATYGCGMLDKPAVLALNKIDTDPKGVKTEKLQDQILNLPESLNEVSKEFHPEKLIEFQHILQMSAKQNKNVFEVTNVVREVMDEFAERQRLAQLEREQQIQSNHDSWTSINQEHSVPKYV